MSTGDHPHSDTIDRSTDADAPLDLHPESRFIDPGRCRRRKLCAAAAPLPGLTVRIGFFGAGVGAMASAEAGEVAALAERLGYASLWTGEHMVLPDERPPYLRIPYDWAFGDPMVMLAYLAAHTSTIRLCTGVVVLPQRHPVQFAKEVATLDVLSRGRFVLGVGVGHLEGEMRAVGLDPRRRAARTVEYLAAMRALWSERPSFSGEFVQFDAVSAFPHPTRPDGPPIIMGGDSAGALARAVTHATGWYGWDLAPDGAARAIERLRSAAADQGRSLDGFEVHVTPLLKLSPELVEEYRQAGVDQLVVLAEHADLDGVRRRLHRYAPAELGVAPAA